MVTQTVLPAGLAFRTLAEDELRGANDLFRAALHDRPASDEVWQVTRDSYLTDRTFGAFDGDRQVGTAMSFPSDLTVPGGATLSMAGVTYVAVRTDYRRRGVLTGLMREQLHDLAACGEVFASLHASEPVIYGRFGYGVATVVKNVTVTSKKAAMRPEVPVAGTVRLLDKDQVLPVLQAAYPAIQPTRVGLMGRSPQWYALGFGRRLKTEYLLVAAHYNRDGEVDGWVAYEPQDPNSADPRANSRLAVLDFQAADQGVVNDLWRFLVGIDLVDEVTAYFRPQDDPLDSMVVDAYAVRSDRDDELWLRIVDAPAALAGRTYGAAPPVVIELVDSLLPNNSGCYRIGPDGATPTSDLPGMTLDAEALAMIYLGAWRPSVLAATGRVMVTDPAAPAAADRLFAVDRPPWNGSMF